MKKLLALILSLCMLLCAAGALAEETDWASFEGWNDVDWDAKTVKYQFTGEWELAEYNICFHFVINLYDDGSAVVDQRKQATDTAPAMSYLQFGYWSEENTEDGNEIAFDTLLCTPNTPGDPLIAHEYSYELYEEEDGNYSFGYTFGIAAGQYFREADMMGGAEIAYPTLAAFHEAVDAPAAE